MGNRLSAALSPYLLQHADNPVDWYPWGEEALQRARALDRPILLSIGYSACHWCHVMAQESFEDPQIAALMNDHFVNVKVDREERPDIDQIYQSVHAMLNRRGGGWPLTVFLAPNQEPFASGTYFPPQPRHGLPAFADVLRRVAQAWREQRDELLRTGSALRAALASLDGGDDAAAAAAHRAAPEAAAAGADRALQALEQAFDPVHGGFGRAPKFLHPSELRFCLEEGLARQQPQLTRIALHTLGQMADGGVFDQLGGGFFRYSVDDQWSIPHFEKMLYDNGQLLGLCADAWVAGADPRLQRAVSMTAGWLEREMRSPQCAFWSSLDADSEGEEGRYYLWRREQIAALLEPRAARAFSLRYGLDEPPNYEGHAWHLRRRRSDTEVAVAISASAAETAALLAQAESAAAAARAQRVRPGTDDKLLAGWNALAVAGLARAARRFGEPRWAALAADAAAFAQRQFWRDGRLHALHKDGQTRLNAYLDDHAFWIDALLELTQTRFEPQRLAFAQQLAEQLLAAFEDADRGGFFFTRHDHEPLIHRPKPIHDGVTASGNGAAAGALLTLGYLIGEPRYVDAAARTVAFVEARSADAPHAACSIHRARALLERPPAIVVLTGPPAATAQWAASLHPMLSPRQLLIDAGDRGDLPPALAKPVATEVQAWLCEGMSCRAPERDLQRLIGALGSS